VGSGGTVPVVWVKRYLSRFKSIPFNLNRFKRASNCSNLNWSKKDLLEPENFEIKYGFEGFDETNNFSYRNSFRFGADFE
jgi:hypothetical protein